MPACASSATTGASRSGGSIPSRTAWLAVTGTVSPRSSTCRASSTTSRSASSAGRSVCSSQCRSTGRPCSWARSSARVISRRGSGARCGQPPITSTPRDAASASTSSGVNGAGEQADLQRQAVADLVAQRDQRVDAAERVALGRDVDVGADGGDAAGGVAGERGAAADEHVGGVDIRAEGAPLLDRGDQVVVLGRAQPARGQRLVQVRVRLARRGQRAPAAGIEFDARAGVRTGFHHPPVTDGDVADRVVAAPHDRAAPRPPCRRGAGRLTGFRWQ